MVPGARDTTWYYYMAFGALGDKIHSEYLGGFAPNIQRQTRSQLHNYTADQKLSRIFVNVDSTPPPETGVYKPYRFEESYWYDALGRRIEARLWRTTNCQSKDPDSGCENTLTRTIWDGSQVLYELRWVFGDTIPVNWSTGYVAVQLSLTVRCLSVTSSPQVSWGQRLTWQLRPGLRPDVTDDR